MTARMRVESEVPSVSVSTNLPSLVRPRVTSTTVNNDADTVAVSSFLHFFAGGIGGMVGSLVTCPFEVIKTRMQSSVLGSSLQHTSISQALRDVFRNEGLGSLWKGITPTLVAVIPSRAVYFYTYQNGKEYLSQLNGNKESSLIHISAAVTSGIITSTASNPAWVVKTRLQLDQSYVGNHRPKLWKAVARQIYQEAGIKGFYKGLTASYFGAAETAIQFAIYEHLKTHTKASDHKIFDLIGENSLPIVTAKLTACLLTYPHEVVRTRMRETPDPKSPISYRSFGSSLKGIFTYEGVPGLYRGLTAHLVRVLPNTAIMFLTYESIVKVFT